MARPLSEEKRKALLSAALEVISAQGLSAPTALIARLAGVGTGTLFVYFPTKEHLFNALYLSIKEDVRQAVSIASAGSVENELRAFWGSYIDWGMQFPQKYRVARYLNASDKLRDETREASWAIFSDFSHLVNEGLEKKILRPQPEEFVGQLVDATANMVIEHCQLHAGELDAWRMLGWQAFWHAVRA